MKPFGRHTNFVWKGYPDQFSVSTMGSMCFWHRKGVGVSVPKMTKYTLQLMCSTDLVPYPPLNVDKFQAIIISRCGHCRLAYFNIPGNEIAINISSITRSLS